MTPSTAEPSFTVENAATYQSFYKTEAKVLIAEYGIEATFGILAHKIDNLNREVDTLRAENARLREYVDRLENSNGLGYEN